MTGETLQPYDIFMLVLLVGAAIFGAWKGMAWQLASLASIVVSAIVSMQFSGALAPTIGTSEPWNRIIAMLILYLATSLGIWLLFRLVAGAIDKLKLKEFDHQVGAGFGLLKGLALCLVITFFVVTLSETGRQAVLKTQSGRYITLLIQKGVPMMPDEIRQALGSYISELDRKLDPNTPAGGSMEERLSNMTLKDLDQVKRELDATKQDLENRFTKPPRDTGNRPATPESRGSSSRLPELRMDDLQSPPSGRRSGT